jgi:hypothetical protein
MFRSRTPAELLMVILNIPAVLFGIVIGWMWISDAVRHYVADDGHPNIRLGMCIGFLMSYLIWNSVVLTYVILTHKPPTDTVPAENAIPSAPGVPVALPITAPIAASISNPPPVRAKPTGSVPTAAPSPDWVGGLAEIHATVSDPPPLPNPPPASWIADVARVEQSSRAPSAPAPKAPNP